MLIRFINKKIHCKLLEKIEINTTSEMVENIYSKLEKNVAAYRKTVGRPLTLTEKILA